MPAGGIEHKAEAMGGARAHAGNLAPRNAARNNSVMTAVPEERRRNRSADPLVALHYQLARTRQEGRLDALVVADDSGVVVAAAGSWAVCEELAAYAPLLVRGVWTDPEISGRSRIAEMRAEVDVQSIEVEGQTVLVCARGGCRRTAALRQAAQGVARILDRAALPCTPSISDRSPCGAVHEQARGGEFGVHVPPHAGPASSTGPS